MDVKAWKNILIYSTPTFLIETNLCNSIVGNRLYGVLSSDTYKEFLQLT